MVGRYLKSKKEYFIGIMSGTSMDGIDAVCIELIDQQWSKVIEHKTIDIPEALKKSLLSLQDTGHNELHWSSVLSNQLTELYIQVTQNLLNSDFVKNKKISAIGCHGQTIRHQPQFGYSIQIANWAKLAEETMIPVVGDFRMTDIVALGEGAPLVPTFHEKIFKDDKKNRVVVNIGGITNITILLKNQETYGYDTGPGNMLMDTWVQQYWGLPFDKDGQLARQGKILNRQLNMMLEEKFFHQNPPKSTGRDLFSLDWLKKYFKSDNKFDVLRTLLELTIVSLSQEIERINQPIDEVIICGGGALNDFLIECLSERLNPCLTFRSDKLLIPPQQVEAAAFAWLANCRIHHIPANLPNATGSRGLRVLGALWEPI